MESRHELAAELIINVAYMLIGAYELFVLPYQDMLGKIVCLGIALVVVCNRTWIKTNIQKLLEALF